MRYLKMALSLPKIIYFNFKVFPWNIAKKMPVFLHYNVKFGSLYKGCIEIKSSNIHPGMIKLGCSMGSAGVFEGEYPKCSGGGYIDIRKDSHVLFNGDATIAGGFSIRVDNGGVIDFGSKFGCNSYCFFAANKLVKIGDDCTLGWHINIRDVDGHEIYLKDDNSKTMINCAREVFIGDHVWIAAYVDILKGTVIPSDSVIAYKTLLTGQKVEEENCIIGGNPPRVLKKGVVWRF